MRLRDVLVKILRNRGIETISTDVERILESDDVIQAMAVWIANGRYGVCEGHRGVAFDLEGRRVEGKAKVHVGSCPNPMLGREELVGEAERVGFPYVVIDCSLYEGHIEKEKRKLKLQINQTLGVIRRFMWDERLIVTGHDFGIGVYYPSTSAFVKEKGLKEVILLDPNGEEVFEGQRAECYVIGGIVDKVGNKRGWTSKLGEKLRREGVEFRSMKILLRGDVIGVPDRLNTIAEIVLRVVLDGEDVEGAIRSVQSRLVARWRLRKELPKRTIRIDVNGRPFRVVRRSVFEEFDWLNLRREDFYRVCSELGYLVLDDGVFDEIVKDAKWDERRGRYVVQGNSGCRSQGR